MIFRLSASCALAAAMVLATPLAVMAGNYTIIFQFSNERPNGEVLTGYITNQGKVTDISNGGLTELGSINFATSGTPSTGHYDVRIHREGNQSHQYCDFHATASYQGRQGWYCWVSQ